MDEREAIERAHIHIEAAEHDLALCGKGRCLVLCNGLEVFRYDMTVRLRELSHE